MSDVELELASVFPSAEFPVLDHDSKCYYEIRE